MKKLVKILSYLLLSLVVLGAVLFALYNVRRARANAQIDWEAQMQPAALGELGSVKQLEILPLYEKEGDAGQFAVGHGVSYLIRADETTLILDVGFEAVDGVPPYLRNMQTLGASWDEVDILFISHPHPDHVGGVAAWRNGTIYIGSDASGMAGKPAYLPSALLLAGAQAVSGAQAQILQPGIGTTGVLSFPEVYPLALLEPRGVEHGLVINVEGQGLVLITGCGHPTLERLVERAELLYGLPVTGVVGGLHYNEASIESLQPHLQFLAQRQPRLVALSPHDSSAAVRQAFAQAFPSAYQPIQVGQAIRFPK